MPIWIAATALASACLAATCSPARAHAFLNAAQPRVGSVIPASPQQVLLTFTQGIEPDFSRIEVQDQSGASVTSGAAHAAGKPTKFAVAVHALAAGTYTVIWHATSVDTHKTQGKFNFSVSQSGGTRAR